MNEGLLLESHPNNMSFNMAELVSAARQELTTAELAGEETETMVSSNDDNLSEMASERPLPQDDRCVSTESRQISVIMSTSEMVDDELDSELKETEEVTEDTRKKPYGGRPLKFQCPHCDRRFHAPSHLKRHVMSHSSERPYRCDVCGKGFLQAWHLGRHMTTHTGNKPFRCTECPKSFGSRFEMKTHINYIHRGIKEHRCNVCGKYFTLRSNLKVHMRKHTGEKPYQCVYCSKRFGQRGHLQYHVRKHTGPTTDFLKVSSNKLSSSIDLAKSPSSPASLPSPSSTASFESPRNSCHEDITSLDSDKDSGVGGCDSDENLSTTSSCHSPSLRDLDEQQLSCDQNSTFNDNSPFFSGRCNLSPLSVPDVSRKSSVNSREIKPFVCHSCNCGFAEVSSLRAHVRHSHPRKGIAVGDFKCGLCLEDYHVIDHLQSHVIGSHQSHKTTNPGPRSSSLLHFPTLKRRSPTYADGTFPSKPVPHSTKAQAFSIESLCKKDGESMDRPQEKKLKRYICSPLPLRYSQSICSPNIALPWYHRLIDKAEPARNVVSYYDHLAVLPKYGCDSLCTLMASRSHCFQLY